MEHSGVQELGEVGNNPQINKGSNVVGSTLTQLFSFNPFRHMHTTGGILWVVFWNDHHRQDTHVLGNPFSILTLQIVVKFLVESIGEFVQQVDYGEKRTSKLQHSAYTHRKN